MQVSPNPILKSGLALAAVAAVAIAISTALSGVHAQNQEPEFQSEALPSAYAEFQYATITGSNNVLNVTMLPVVTPTGTVYKNLTIPVTTEASGAIVLGTPSEVNAPQILASSFKAGKYSGPSSVNDGKNVITVTGPGVVPGGTTVWSLVSSSSPSVCTYPVSGTWYVGPLSNNPLAARLKKVGISSTAYSWGVAGNPGLNNTVSCNPGLNWSNGSIIGVSQTGNSITFSSFTSDGSFDKSYPVDQITYTYQ
jgi:hypothetical protein